MLSHDTINGLLTIAVLLFMIAWGLSRAEDYNNYHDDDDDIKLN